MLAVLSNHREIVSWLVSIDPACIKIQIKDNVSVLKVAAANGKTEIASVLLKSLQNFLYFIARQRWQNGFPPVVFRKSFPVQQIEEYKNYKSESDPLLHTIQYNNGITPLMLVLPRNHLEKVSWLASIDPACIKLQNKDKLSVLHVAAANGITEIASFLLKAVNQKEKTVLHFAAAHDKTEIVSVLLKSLNSSDKSSLISSPDDEGGTAFHWLCSQGHLEFSKWLLEEYKNCKSSLMRCYTQFKVDMETRLSCWFTEKSS